MLLPDGAMKAVRMRRPSSVRTGMFCRFGSEEERRPVVVAAVVNGRLHSVQVPYAVDEAEAALQVLRKTSGEVRFGFHPKAPVVGAVVQLRLW